MSYKELAEIVDMINEIEILNPRPSKVEISSTTQNHVLHNQASKQHSPRKPSLPLYSSNPIKIISQCNSKENFLETSRKSLFQFERSYSSVNLTMQSSESLNMIPDTEILLDDFDAQSKKRIRKQSSLLDNIQIYESIPTQVKNEYMNSESLGLTTNYLEMKNFEEFEAINIKPQIPMKPKNSIDLAKNLKMRHSIISEDYRDSPQRCSEYNQKLKSAPQSTRNSECIKNSIPKLENLSSDSGISSGILTNKIGSNILTFSISNEQGTSSESSFEISDSYPVDKSPNEVFIIETDSPTMTEKQNENSLSSNKSEKLAEMKSIRSEEDKIKFFQKISKDISLQTYSIKEIIRFHLPNGTFSSQLVDKSQTASSVCSLLKIHFNINPKAHWQLIEVLHIETLERPLEDHENILEVYYSWKSESICNRFLFQENPNMYKIFLQPCVFKSEMECDFEIESTIWVKEASSKWRKLFCFISDTTVYFKIKPESRDHKDLYTLVNVKHCDFYSCADNTKIKKCYKAPTNELIIFKTNKMEHKSQGQPCICALNSEQKEKWLEALKVAKYSFKQLKQNYLNSENYSEIKTSKQTHSTDYFGLSSI